MKKIEALNNSKSPIAIYNKKLDEYENMPLFQGKVDKVNAILAKNPPTQVMRAIENQRIKAYFEQEITLEQMAVNMNLTENEVSLRLTEMGLVQFIKV